MKSHSIINNQSTSFENTIIILSLALFPLLHLTLRGWTNIFTFILFGISLFHVLKFSSVSSIKSITKTEWAVIAALSSGFLAILISQTLRHQIYLKAYDGPLRMLLAGPIFLLLVNKKINFIQIFQYICPLSLIILFLSLQIFPHQMDIWNANGRFATYYLGPNEFGNSTMLLTFMTLFSINALSKDSIGLKTLKYTGFALGLYLEIKSQTRGAWILEPIMLALWVAINWKSKSVKELLSYGLIVMFLILVAYFFVDFFHARIDSISAEITSWLNKSNTVTSTGIRFTMWQIAWELIKQSPIYGYGDLGYQVKLLLPEIQSRFSHDAISTIYGAGPHNEFIANTLRSGIFGLVAASLQIFVPMIIFTKGLNSTDREKKANSAIGLCFVIGLMVTGFSLEVLTLKFINSYYGLMIACMCASIIWEEPIKVKS